jgi:hypothetical protein
MGSGPVLSGDGSARDLLGKGPVGAPEENRAGDEPLARITLSRPRLEPGIDLGSSVTNRGASHGVGVPGLAHADRELRVKFVTGHGCLLTALLPARPTTGS